MTEISSHFEQENSKSNMDVKNLINIWLKLFQQHLWMFVESYTHAFGF